MQYVNFGGAGVKVSRVALGMGLRGQSDEKGARELVAATLDLGVNLLDCANIYGLGDDRRLRGTSEMLLGKALQGPPRRSCDHFEGAGGGRRRPERRWPFPIPHSARGGAHTETSKYRPHRRLSDPRAGRDDAAGGNAAGAGQPGAAGERYAMSASAIIRRGRLCRRCACRSGSTRRR